MVALLADRPVLGIYARVIDDVAPIARIGRCDSCRQPSIPLVAVTFGDGKVFEVGACCMP